MIKPSPSAVRIAADRTIDSGLQNLFEWFLVVANTGELSLEEVMSYELSPFPPALFDSINVFIKADKPQLAHAISEHAPDGILDFCTRDRETRPRRWFLTSSDTVEKKEKATVQ